MENLVKLTIDGVSVEVPAGTTVLEAAKKAGINIPTLCYLKNINQIGACRMCIVDTGARAFGAACVLPVANGMNVNDYDELCAGSGIIQIPERIGYGTETVSFGEAGRRQVQGLHELPEALPYGSDPCPGRPRAYY